MNQDITQTAAEQLEPDTAPQLAQESTTETVLNDDSQDQATEQSQEAAPASNTPDYKAWSNLPSDKTLLIRLAALPADRDTGLRPMYFATLSRTSRHDRAFSMLKLKVDVAEQNIDSSHNKLEIWVDHKQKEVRLREEEILHTNPANRGLGRFILAQAAEWLNKRWPDYKIKSTPLLAKHVANDNARLRRDHALQAQGFTVTYEDGVQMRGNCSAERASKLHSNWNSEKVRIIPTEEAASILQNADKTLKTQESEINQLEARMKLLSKDDQTLKFTITMLVIFAVFQAILLIWMATR